MVEMEDGLLLIYIKYFLKIIKHKMYVLSAVPSCRKMLLRLILHDMSKFLPSEFFSYARYWGTEPKKRSVHVINAFECANRLHNKRNKHHWEHWVVDYKDKIANPMDVLSVSEMLYDWRAAGLAYKGVDDSGEYYEKNSSKMILNDSTRAQVDAFFARPPTARS